MKKIVSILLIILLILAIFTSILFAEEIKSTFQNEPDGFRGLKWGDPPTEDMTFSYQVISEYGTVGNYYRRSYIGDKMDKLNIGNAKINSITYIFNLYSNQFYKVFLFFKGEDNYNILKIICEGKFGKQTQGDKYSHHWFGDKARVSLYFNSKKKEGVFGSESEEFHPEKPEDNKQKELEKAKDDF